jgi:hypothetical protein
MPQRVLPNGAHWLLTHVLPAAQHCWLHTCPSGQQRPSRHCSVAWQHTLPQICAAFEQQTPLTH